MATLNRDEQATHNRVAELETARRNGTAFVSDGELNQARQLAEYATNNAAARERYQAELAAEQKAVDNRTRARMDAAATAVSEAFLAQARHSYPGTDTEWQAEKGDILKAWRQQQVLNAQNDTMERKRQLLNDVF
jgi:hypothetical protein